VRKKTSTAPLLLVGGGGDCPDIEYATGFRATDPVVFLQAGARRYLVVPQMEEGRARRLVGGVTILTPEALRLRGARGRRLSAWAEAVLERAGVKAVAVSGQFPYGVARGLLRRGVRLNVAAGEVLPERAVKRPDELKRIAEAQQAAVIAMRAAVGMISRARVDADGCLRQGSAWLTSEEVRRVIARGLLEHDCVCRDAIVAGGKQAADPHEVGHGPLHAQEPIVIDIFPQHLGHGYWGDLTRTVVRGTPSRALVSMYQAVRCAQAAALASIRSGVMCGTVHRRAVEEFERRQFRTSVLNGRGAGFIHGTGHGVGLAVHEAPSLGLNTRRLRSGNVVTVEPGLYYPGIGGVRLEDTVVVTASGWRYLVPCEKKFEV
jgi:Xaa-Pro aminopeptidase